MVPQCYAQHVRLKPDATQMSTPVTSRKNAIVARYRAVAHGEVDGLLLLDGAHLVRDAIAAGVTIEHAAVDEDAAQRDEILALLKSLHAAAVDTVTVTPAVMSVLSPVRSPSAIVAIARRPERDLDELYTGAAPLVVIASDIQDPGNLGAIIRVAEAGGASSVLAAGACADPFSWKALRGSMGSALRFPVDRVDDAAQAAAEARKRGCRIIATVPRDGRSMFDTNLRLPTAILIGGEGPGLSQALVSSADERITIPMHAPVESLNAAVTAALVIYEARRQRLR